MQFVCAIYMICVKLYLLAQMVLDTQDDKSAESSPCWFSIISKKYGLSLSPSFVGICERDTLQTLYIFYV